MTAASIQGMGIVCTRGRGADALESALSEGWRPPLPPADPAPEWAFPVYRIAAETLSDKAVLRSMRRADRFSKVAALAAWDAACDAGIAPGGRRRTGIVLASAFGPHVTTFKFLDDIIEYGCGGVSPTIFSHSVHNAAASYIAGLLDCHGPTQTVTRFGFSFHEALRLALAWLEEDRCDHVLLGAVDECGTAMEYCCSRMLRPAPDGKIRPFDFAREPVAVPGEAGVFFVLARPDAESGWARIAVPDDTPAHDVPEADLLILDTNGMAGDESGLRDWVPPTSPAAAYAPLFGSIMTGTALSAAVAALALRRGTAFGSPVVDNPHGLLVCAPGAPVSRIVCAKQDCSGRVAMVELGAHV